jgi:hypothetical protein
MGREKGLEVALLLFGLDHGSLLPLESPRMLVVRSAKFCSFLSGVGSVLNIWPAPLPPGRIGHGILQPSDAEAIRGDCDAVASDFWRAIRAERACVEEALPIYVTKSLELIAELSVKAYRESLRKVTAENFSAGKAAASINLDELEALARHFAPLQRSLGGELPDGE